MASTTPAGEVVEPLRAVDAVVRRLVRRERALLLLDVTGRAVLLLVGLLLLAVFAATFRWGRSEVAAVMVFLAGAGAWFAVVRPLWARWSLAGDPLRQARLVEAVAPDLRGRLVTAVETGQRGLEGGESQLMVGLMARRAVAVASKVAPRRIHAGIAQAILVVAALVASVLPLPLSFLAGGPTGVLGWWAKGLEASGAAAMLQALDTAERAQVGDLVLHYTYPAYTGLEPRTIENSTGDVSGPPGTVVEVRARSGEPVEAAGLVAYEQRYEARVEEERTLVGNFTIGADEGTYHLVTWRGETSQDSREFQITPEEDLPPEVLLDATSPVLELAVDEDLELIWRVRDDYGVQRVLLRIDGKDIDRLYSMEERRAEVFGDELTTPGELGLAPGDEVELSIAAWDNNTIGGASVGVSQPVRLVVLGAKGLSDRTEEQRDQLIEAMLTVLADHLVDPFPPGATIGRYAAWGELVSKRYAPLQELVDSEWDRLAPDSLERSALEDAVNAGGELVRFAAVTFDRGSMHAPAVDDVEDLRALRADAIASLEDGILMLDRARRNQALAQAVETATHMEELAADLERVLSQENPDPLQMLAMLEQLQQMMLELAKQSAKLDEGGLKEFLNARQEQMGGLMEEIRKAIEEGRMDDARELMKRLADQMQQMAEGLRDTMERQQGEASDSMAQAEQLMEELEQLENEQRELQQQVQELRDQEDQETAREQNMLWEKIRAESEATLRELATYEAGLLAADRSFSENQRVQSARRDAERLDQATRREDVRGARSGLRNTQFGVDAMQRGFKTARLMATDKLQGPGRRELDQLMKHLETIERLLDQLDQAQSNPQTSAQSQQLQQQQQQLEQRLESAQQAASEMMKEFQANPGEMKEQMDKAGERMEEASQDLQQGKPMQAQGSQGAAADNLREARESLQKAMQQAQQQQQQSGRSGQKQPRPKSGDESGKQNHDRPRVELPGAEEFRTPEEYRKALLEGMEGEVPEEFRAMKKRYFEELVRQ